MTRSNINIRLTRSLLSTLAVLFAFSTAIAQNHKFDKGDADELLYEQLTSCNVVENWHRELIIDEKKLTPTDEENIYVLPGDTLQTREMRSDIYVIRKGNTLSPLFDKKYPLESANNLLLNVIKDNTLQLSLVQRQYGNKQKKATVPLQTVYDLLGRHNDIYVNVTRIDPKSIEAVLVFHQKGINTIHMFIVNIPVENLFVKGATVTAELYGNIPQGNVKSINRRRKQ